VRMCADQQRGRTGNVWRGHGRSGVVLETAAGNRCQNAGARRADVRRQEAAPEAEAATAALIQHVAIGIVFGQRFTFDAGTMAGTRSQPLLQLLSVEETDVGTGDLVRVADNVLPFGAAVGEHETATASQTDVETLDDTRINAAITDDDFASERLLAGSGGPRVGAGVGRQRVHIGAGCAKGVAVVTRVD